MEHCIVKRNNLSDITYLSELIPTSVLKFSKKILGHLTSRDRNNNYPSLKLAKILFDNFSQSFGINSHNNLLTLSVFVSYVLI